MPQPRLPLPLRSCSTAYLSVLCIFIAADVIVSFSRIYVGTQYASDVLGGTLTGVVASARFRMPYWNGTRTDRAITGIF